MDINRPAEQVGAFIYESDNRFGLDVLGVMVPADATGQHELKGFKELFRGVFIRIGGVLGISERCDMNRVPEKGSPDGRCKLHLL